MACKTSCKLCDHLIVSENIAVTSGVVVVTLPTGTYLNGEKYCIVLAQTIPTTAAISAPVQFIINGGDTRFPLNDCECRQVTACGVRTRTRYSTRLVTNATGAVFRMLGHACCCPENNLPLIDENT